MKFGRFCSAVGSKPEISGAENWPALLCSGNGRETCVAREVRRKEGTEGNQSNRPGAAHSEHTASDRCGGGGRVLDYGAGHFDRPLPGFQTANGR
jgi:hypothetical protein